MQESSQQITELLAAWGQGDKEAFDRLFGLVYDELRRMAKRFMRGQHPDHTLQATALVNEAYMRLVDSDKVRWQDRTHFFAIAAQLMRRVLVDCARAKQSLKRGGGAVHVTLDEKADLPHEREADIVALDEALERLAKLNRRHVQIVELRYFGGLSEDEIAGVLDISSRTVRRDWNVARAWLFRELRHGHDDA